MEPTIVAIKISLNFKGADAQTSRRIGTKKVGTW